MDGLSQEPVFEVEKTLLTESGETVNLYKSSVEVRWKAGTWPFGSGDYARLIDGQQWQTVADDLQSKVQGFRDQIESLCRGYALFNPHLSLSLDWFGERVAWEATDTAWKKWGPSQPTPIHWYDLPRFKRLVVAYILADRESNKRRTVADFLKLFDGLRTGRKRNLVTDAAGMQRFQLSELAGDRKLHDDLVERLLIAMKQHTRPVTHKRLGKIGEQHFRRRLEEFGCNPKSITYKACARIDKGMPVVLESAFGDLGKGTRRLFAGANWSPGIKNPFRSFGTTGEGLEAVLNQARVGRGEPIVFAMHLAHPRIQYADRGKSSLIVGD
jgi:hypothetical protein